MSAPEARQARAVPSGRTVGGAIVVPPSKSVSHRYLNLALLARQPLAIERLLDAEDIRHFRAALEALGFRLEESGSTLAIEPPAEGPREAEIFCGNAGTLYRFLTASLTVVPGDWVLDGSPRLRERPIAPLVETLRELGARIRYREREGRAPLQIQGGTLTGGETTLDAAESSQYASALVMASACARRRSRVRLRALVSSPYLEITLAALREFGVVVERDAEGAVLEVEPGGLRSPGGVVVEGDYSAATYPAVAALVTGGRVSLLGLQPDSTQGDRDFFRLLEAAGARVEATASGVDVWPGRLRAIHADMRDMPDQVPTLAALAPFLEGTTAITGAAHLRIKESDRLAAMASELARAGVPVRELAGGLVVEGSWHDREPPSDPVVIDAHDDHRIAMSMALVGLRRPGIAIADPDVVGKSYPNFWRDLETLLG
ncbi:MAG TPA: 3-phosphoshikimate 1-carboxyvinyltransferase [Thermoanaerobaculia bacterium]|nr:3-phosphoshikimate 1-carboxyvinyltransferase [Thermoanaerobaculia bacterium]